MRHGATRTVHRFPAGHTCGEPIFVPRVRGGAADTGVTFAHDRGRGTSYLAILDAANHEADPAILDAANLDGSQPRSGRLAGGRLATQVGSKPGRNLGRFEGRAAPSGPVDGLARGRGRRPSAPVRWSPRFTRPRFTRLPVRWSPRFTRLARSAHASRPPSPC
ncbi:carotenoid oxygenase family protein [Sorangium sp. So ce1389]|uniref:carotenoid oxygenase family protein n=1 Tax=Sorangium sp. So ce1389 TaxID=3133336 RepID=UPI003F645E27